MIRLTEEELHRLTDLNRRAARHGQLTVFVDGPKTVTTHQPEPEQIDLSEDVGVEITVKIHGR
jgi:hypothetical protein